MRRVKAHLTLIRPANSLMVGLAVVVGEVVALGKIPGYYDGILGFLVGFLVSSSAMILNDVFDLEIDAINEPERPIPSGVVSVKEAKLVGITYGVIGCILSLLLGPIPFIIAASFWGIAILYNLRGKMIGLLGNSMVSASVAIPYVFGGVVAGDLSFTITILAMMSFLANMGREVAKGVIDLEGDLAKGYRTLAITRGKREASLVSVGFLFSAVVLSPLPYFTGGVGFYYIALISIADLIMVLSSIYILRDYESRERLKRAKSLILLGMMIGLCAFLAGAIWRWGRWS